MSHFLFVLKVSLQIRKLLWYILIPLSRYMYINSYLLDSILLPCSVCRSFFRKILLCMFFAVNTTTTLTHEINLPLKKEVCNANQSWYLGKSKKFVGTFSQMFFSIFPIMHYQARNLSTELWQRRKKIYRKTHLAFYPNMGKRGWWL